MAGMGRTPKPAGAQKGHSPVRHVTAAILYAPEPDQLDAPKLPRRPEGWHPLTRAWWADLWASPMAPEYDDSDRPGLLMLAALVDDLWRAETARDRLAAAVEVRLQGARYGLSPIDRRRLQWEIERTDAAQGRGRRRLSSPGTATDSMASAEDPRDILR